MGLQALLTENRQHSTSSAAATPPINNPTLQLLNPQCRCSLTTLSALTAAVTAAAEAGRSSCCLQQHQLVCHRCCCCSGCCCCCWTQSHAAAYFAFRSTSLCAIAAAAAVQAAAAAAGRSRMQLLTLPSAAPACVPGSAGTCAQSHG
jgi:hypothetical protein